MNVSSSEIEKFSKLSNQWWDLNGPLKTLHHINPTRLDFTLKHTQLKNKCVLDIGCGGGVFSEALAKEGAMVTAIDLSENVINVAKEHAKQSKLEINYQAIALENLKASDFDIITCYELLEHVPEPNQLILEAKKRLKVGGKLFLSTINRTPKAYLYTIVGAEYLLNILPRQTHEYNRFIKPSELSQFARDAGLTVRSIRGLDYQPFTKKASITDNVSVNYLMVCEKE